LLKVFFSGLFSEALVEELAKVSEVLVNVSEVLVEVRN
jgi:hypothetical protein